MEPKAMLKNYIELLDVVLNRVVENEGDDDDVRKLLDELGIKTFANLMDNLEDTKLIDNAIREIKYGNNINGFVDYCLNRLAETKEIVYVNESTKNTFTCYNSSCNIECNLNQLKEDTDNEQEYLAEIHKYLWICHSIVSGTTRKLIETINDELSDYIRNRSVEYRVTDEHYDELKQQLENIEEDMISEEEVYDLAYEDFQEVSKEIEEAEKELDSIDEEEHELYDPQPLRDEINQGIRKQKLVPIVEMMDKAKSILHDYNVLPDTGILLTKIDGIIEKQEGNEISENELSDLVTNGIGDLFTEVESSSRTRFINLAVNIAYQRRRDEFKKIGYINTKGNDSILDKELIPTDKDYIASIMLVLYYNDVLDFILSSVSTERVIKGLEPLDHAEVAYLIYNYQITRGINQILFTMNDFVESVRTVFSVLLAVDFDVDLLTSPDNIDYESSNVTNTWVKDNLFFNRILKRASVVNTSELNDVIQKLDESMMKSYPDRKLMDFILEWVNDEYAGYPLKAVYKINNELRQGMVITNSDRNLVVVLLEDVIYVITDKSKDVKGGGVFISTYNKASMLIAAVYIYNLIGVDGLLL